MLKYYDETASEWKKVTPNVLGNNSVYTNQKPTGALNGTNTLFTLGTPYQAGTLEVYKNGIYLSKIDEHYTETDPEAGTFTMAVAPVSTDIITANYQRTLINSGNADTVDGFHASATPEPNKIPVLNADGKMPGTTEYSEYSLDEKIVGKWIDGRPIYRKVIDIGTGPNAGNKDTAYNIPDLDRLVSLNVVGKDGGSFIEANTPATSGYDRCIIFSGIVRLSSSTNRSGYTFHAIMEYTKT